jgi:hypothetical protein
MLNKDSFYIMSLFVSPKLIISYLSLIGGSVIEAIVAGRQGDCYILPILEGLASVARDYKRDIYSRFLHLAREISL